MKNEAKAARDSLQQGIYKVINPLVKGMIKVGITPNCVTTIGFLGNLAGAVLIARAGYKAAVGVDYSLLTLAGALIIGFSLFDMLDGQVARIGGMVSRFGAMYDSVLDRYSELCTLGALSYYMLCITNHLGAILTFLALIGSIMVSYIRARAEGLDVECKIGFMQRPERVVLTSLAIIATGISGQAGCRFDVNIILVVAMCVIAVFANITALSRLFYVKGKLNN